MRGLFNKPLGACGCAPNVFKNIDPAVTAAIIGGAASIASGAMSTGAAMNLNKDNREYDYKKWTEQLNFNRSEAVKSRIQQQRLMQMEQDWNERMYNQYNSPSALRQQYSAAGYNPYLVSADGGLGHSPMSASSPSAPSASMASVGSSGVPQQFMPDFSGIANAGEVFARMVNMNANSANQQSEALNNVAKLIPELHKVGYSDEEIRKIVAPFIASTQGINSNQDLIFNSARLNYLERENSLERNKLELELSKRFSAKERQQRLDESDQLITESVAKIGLMASEGNLNDAKIKQIAQDIKESLSRIYRNYAEGSLADASGFQLMELFPYVETQSKKAAAKADLEERETFQNSYINKFDKSVTGKAINTMLWYLSRFMSSGNVNVGVKVPTGR